MYKIKLSPYAKIFYTEWLLDPSSSRYNLSIDQTLYGSLNIDRLKSALNKYISDHVILNSHIQNINEEPHWVKNDSINELEYSEEPTSTQELFSYVSCAFDLHSKPLYRFKLIRLDKDTCRLILVFHHIVIDGSASLDSGVFEAISNYHNDESYSVKHSIDDQIKLISNLTDKLSIDLDQHKEKYKDFWHKQLSDIDSVDLSFLKLCKNPEQKNTAESLNSKAEINFSFSDAELAKLNQIKLKYGITPYVYGQCIFALLLHRYAGQDKIAISYPIAIKEGLDFIYGSQLNTNIITYQFNQTTTIIDLFNQNKEFFSLTMRSDIKYGYYPIANIIHDCASKQLLNTCFNQAFFIEHPFEFDKIITKKIFTELSTDGIAKDTLLFEHNIRNKQLSYRVRYDKTTIDGSLLSSFVVSYQRLYFEILNDLLAENNNKLVSAYNILDQKQYQQVMYEFNKTDKDYPHDKTIHQLFEEQVLKTPNNIAVVYEDTKLIYQELNNKANQLAHYLRQHYDIKPDDLVALCLDRSEQMLIAMLGVLKAGGAYVPIDPSYPYERIWYVLNDTKTKVVLTNEIYANKIQQLVKSKKVKTDVVAIDSKKIQVELTNQKNINSITKTKSGNLAYVIYTSGTTGNSKGVMIEHNSVVNCITYIINYNELNDKSIGSQYASISFDASVVEIYPILLSGGILHIVPDQYKLDVIKINNFFCKNKIIYGFLPTKFAELFFNLKNKSLINLIAAGEKLEKFTKQTYRLINAYGPTEATVHTTDFIVNHQYSNIPVGKPINNVKCYVVDNNLSILPIGAYGELVIGGECLARGYLNNPDLTAEKFISNPFQTKEEKSQNKNHKLYKTGDLVRWLPDGNLEYIGRNDSQVKIRGYRIELGEIENKLLNYPNIKQAAVLAKERSAEKTIDKYLLAYYVSDKKLDEEKIQSFLSTQLPEYMLPKILVHINKLPLTTNGKLDKKALPEPELTNQSECILPRNKLEENICAMYAQVLNLPITQVGIKSDFFKIGGDSISSIQLVYRIRQKLSLNISVTDIFTYRNVEQLVKNVLTNPNTQENIINIKREDNPIEKSDFLPIQEWFFDNVKNCFYQNHNHWNQSFIIKTPELDLEILKLSVEKLLQHHDAFRFRYKNFEENYIEVDFSKEENIKSIDISNLTSTEIKNKLIEIQSNFNIETGPLYTIAYLHGYKDKTARLFFAMHHLIIDSVSWRIITEDISRLYELFQDKNNFNKTSQELLGQKGTSYRQWVEEVKNYKPSKQELNYWDCVLKDYIHAPKSINQESHSEFLLTPEITQKLLTKAGAAYDTQVNDILLSALSRTLAQVFNRKVNHITLEGHGREEMSLNIDITKTMGWFTTMYPASLVDQPNIPDLIKTTKEKLKNIPNKGIGYGPIKGYKNLPNISFNYLGQISNAEGFWVIEDHIISMDPQNQNSNILDIYGYVINNTLKFHVSCNDSLPFNAKVFADKFKSNLEELIEHCFSKNTINHEDSAQDREMFKLLHQVKLNYAKKANENQISKQLQNKIDCYLENANNQQQNLFLQKPITNVLLAGSTGFLGCNLLNQLLKLTNYNIFLLVRADSQTAAIDRINKKFQFYFDKTLDDVYKKRVFILKSDLVDNNLGLSDREYQDLIVKIDSVIHAAALVKLYGDYDNFYLQNVQSTINLLEFAKLTKLKDFHYVSTCSVLDKSRSSICTEDDILSDIEQDSFYLKTKSQGEYQTIKYRDYGIKSNIYRVGTLAFMAENLRTQENLEESGFLNWVKCLFKLQCIAKEIGNVNVSPADLTAKAIVKLFDKDNLSNQIHHVFNPYLFNMSESVFENSKYKMDVLSIDKFIDRVIDEMRNGTNENLIMKFLLYQGWMDDENINTIRILQDRTQHILKRLDFVWKPQTTIKTFFVNFYK